MAVSYDRIARDIAFTLEIKSPKIFENIFLNNGVLCLLAAKGKVKVVRGGNRFDERVHLGMNSNVDFRSKFAEIPVAYQNNFQTAQYGMAVISGAVPVNLVEVDQNAGDTQISSLTEGLVDELMNTFPNKLATALLQATAGATDPLSLAVELPATAYGSQTQVTGGITRSDYPGVTDKTAAWQTQYVASGGDLSAASGIATVSKALYSMSSGSSVQEQPDIALTTMAVLAKMQGGAEVLRRFGVNDTLVKYNFDNFKVNQCAFIGDIGVGAGIAYVLNTNYAHFQVLAGPKTRKTGALQVIGDGATEVPLQVSAPIPSANSLQYNILAYLVGNLTFGGLKQHGRIAGLTEA